MLVIIIFSFMVLYFVIALVIVFFVWRRTTRKLYRFLAVAFVILLPSWDAVLSAIIFYTACPFIPKAEIYETAETEGIYYEGFSRDTVYIGRRNDGVLANSIGLVANEDINKGYQYMEFLVTKKHDLDDKETTLPRSIIYRCIEDRKDSVSQSQCYPVEEIKSKYMVKSAIYSFTLIEVGFVKIYERSTGRLMAEYREITKYQYSGVLIPFFTWLNWGRGSSDFVRCPKKSQLFTFQYEVLKVKKPPS